MPSHSAQRHMKRHVKRHVKRHMDDTEDEDESEASDLETTSDANSVTCKGNKIYFYGSFNKQNIIKLRAMLADCVQNIHQRKSIRLKLIKKQIRYLRETISAIREDSTDSDAPLTERTKTRHLSRLLRRMNKREFALSRLIHKQELGACKKDNIISIYINSHGGDAELGLLAYDIVRRCPVQVYTIVDGICESAATLLLLAGDRRYLAENATVMIHDVRITSVCGNSKELQVEQDNLQNVTEKVIAIYKKNSTMSLGTIKKEMSTDGTWTRDKAIEYGFASSLEAPF